jgi:hypothetical protein
MNAEKKKTTGSEIFGYSKCLRNLMVRNGACAR